MEKKSNDILLLFKESQSIMFDFQRLSYSLCGGVSTPLQVKRPRTVRSKEKVIGMRSLEEKGEEPVRKANSQLIYDSGLKVIIWGILSRIHIPGLHPRSI